MRIEVLYFRGCPNSRATIDLVRRTAVTHGVRSPIETVEVGSLADAVRLRFLGSPTVRVNGVDVDPAARGRSDFGMVCRLYGSSGVPSADAVAAAIHEPACG